MDILVLWFFFLVCGLLWGLCCDLILWEDVIVVLCEILFWDVNLVNLVILLILVSDVFLGGMEFIWCLEEGVGVLVCVEVF